MNCPQCHEREVEKDRKLCSACRKRTQRQKESPEKEVVPEKITTQSGATIQKAGHTHWFGKAPHKPIFTSCAKPDCPLRDAPEPEWTPTCTEACCADDEPQKTAVYVGRCVLCGKDYETPLRLMRFCSDNCKAQVMVVIAQGPHPKALTPKLK